MRSNSTALSELIACFSVIENDCLRRKSIRLITHTDVGLRLAYCCLTGICLATRDNLIRTNSAKLDDNRPITVKGMRILFVGKIMATLLFAGCSNLIDEENAPSIDPKISSAATCSKWKLVWSDEFYGSSLDSSKWISESGPGPWGLNELEYYTDGSNIEVVNGNLAIEARKEAYGERSFTSGRIRTADAWTYGKIEIRVKLPFGQGMFPAFWLISGNYTIPGKYGEIDIFEMVGSNTGSENATIWGSVHRPDMKNLPEHLKSVSHFYVTPDLAWFNDDFHVFGIEWSKTKIKFYVDGIVYQTVKINPDGSDGWSALQQPMHIVLNLAVGGDWAKAPDEETRWPQQTLVDWVRIYQENSLRTH